MTILDFPGRTLIPDYVMLLDELLPNIKRYGGDTFVIYYNGSALYERKLATQFAHDVVLLRQLGINVIITHGGEAFVDSTHKKLKHPSRYVDGDRFTDADSIEIVEMSMALINKRIVTQINDAGGSAIGISGKDANLIEARKYRMARSKPNTNVENIIDLGFVGEPTIINPDLLLALEDTDFIPVISPIASGENGETFHIDPLTTAAVVSSALIARKLVILSDNNDVIAVLGGAGKVIDYKNMLEVSQELGKHNSGKILQFLNNCISVMQNRTESINILDGSLPHALLLDLFTNQKCGVLIEGEFNNNF